MPQKRATGAEFSAITPESLLPKGEDDFTATNPYTQQSGVVRKGTVAATLQNIAFLNEVLKKSPLSIKNTVQVEDTIRLLHSLIPSLRVVGMFDLFRPEEWLQDETQPGRLLTALIYLHRYPKQPTVGAKNSLAKLKTRNPRLLVQLNRLLEEAIPAKEATLRLKSP